MLTAAGPDGAPHSIVTRASGWVHITEAQKPHTIGMKAICDGGGATLPTKGVQPPGRIYLLARSHVLPKLREARWP
jgi:hypothetical protein